MNKLTTQEEHDRIMEIYGRKNPLDALNLIDRQLATLVQRAQILLGLCGMVVTVTGFSGRIIAGTNRLAQTMIITGITLILITAVMLVRGVLNLTWLTQQPYEDDIPDLIFTGIKYRDEKVRFYRHAVNTLAFGLTCYVIAIAIMLLFPHASTVTPAR